MKKILKKVKKTLKKFLTIVFVFDILIKRLRDLNARNTLCGGGSVVERRLAKANVAGPNPVLRSIWEHSSVG